MEKKYMFFDVDGTLTNDNPGGIITQNTLDTLQKLKDNGHFVAIASGRAQYLALEAAKISGIDNLVTDGGNGITLNGKLKYIKPLDRQKALEIIDEALVQGYPVNVAIDNSPRLYSSNTKQPQNQMHHLILDENFDYHQAKDIYKIFITIKEDEEQKLSKLKTLGYMRYFEDGIIIEPDDKYQGIVEMVKLIEGDLKDIVVFGDGHNDYTMFKQAPISIAMGNAIEELKEIAAFVTKDNQHDGITYACRHFGWIK